MVFATLSQKPHQKKKDQTTVDKKTPKHSLLYENHTKLEDFKLFTKKPPKNKRHTPRGGRRTRFLVVVVLVVVVVNGTTDTGRDNDDDDVGVPCRIPQDSSTLPQSVAAGFRSRGGLRVPALKG